MVKVFSLFLLMISFSSFAQDKQYVDLGAKVIQVGDKSLLAVSFNNTKKWHTYWKNPGDAGLAIKVRFEIDGKEITLKDYPWPAPKRYIEQGNMWAYGYGDKYAFFYDTTDKLKNKTLTITGEWLVCKDICIPGTRTVNLKLDQNLMGEVNAFISESQLLETYSFLPKVKKESFNQIILN